MSQVIDTITKGLVDNIERVLINNKNDISVYDVSYGLKITLNVLGIYIRKIQNEISQNPLFIDFQNKKRRSWGWNKFSERSTDNK